MGDAPARPGYGPAAAVQVFRAGARLVLRHRRSGRRRTTAVYLRTSTTRARSTTGTSAAPTGLQASSRCAASSVEYHAPARFDELIEAFVRISRIGRTSVTYECAATREPDGALLATATQTIVLIDPIARRPVPVPEAFRAPVRLFEQGDLVE